MTDYQWFRVWNEIAVEKKLKRCSNVAETHYETVVGAFIVLLTLANTSPRRGELFLTETEPFTKSELIAEFSTPKEQSMLMFESFIALGLIKERKNGAYVIKNWGKRQFQSDSSTPRVRRFRQAKQQRNVTGNVSATPPDNIHDDDVKGGEKEKNLKSFRENLDVLGIDYQGGKDLTPKRVAKWAENVEYIPPEWGAGILVLKIRAGESPPKPSEPDQEIPTVAKLPKREKPTPAQKLWGEIKTALPQYKDAFIGAVAVGLTDNCLKIKTGPLKREWLENRLNGQLTKTAQGLTGQDITIEFITADTA